MADTTYTQLASNMCEAIETLIANAITNADFDKTVSATVTGVIDEETGTYKVQYLGGDYIVTATNPDEKYSVSDSVYLLVPGGDFTNAKKILGTVSELGESYLSTTKETAKYDIMGSNVIETISQKYFNYCSYKPTLEILYDADQPKEKNKLVVNEEALKANMKKATYLRIGADVKTTIPQEQWGKGNFGLVVEIEYFLHEKSTEAVPVKFLFDTASMTGTIFNIPIYLSQHAMLRAGTGLYNRIKSITAFVSDFPNTKAEDESILNDISFKNIGIYTAIESDNEKWDSYYIQFSFPNGDTLKENMNSLTIEATTTFKNRTIDNSKLEYYWFVENSAVDIAHSDYCSYGGVGWQCLNNFSLEEVVGQTSITTKKTWLPASYDFIVKREELLANTTTYKCVVNYPAKEGEIDLPSKEFQLFNLQAEYSLNITSSTGLDYFILGRGMTDLVCEVKINGEVSDADQFNFHWTQENSAGIKSIIDVDTGGTGKSISNNYTNTELYNLLASLRNTMYSDFDDGTLQPSDTYYTNYFIPKKNENNSNQAEVDAASSAMREINSLLEYSYEDGWTYKIFYDKLCQYINATPISFIQGNTFYDLSPSIIDGTNTFTCAVYIKNSEGKDAAYVGTASFTVKNIQTVESSMYYAELVNGNQVFKYSSTGHSPLNRDNEQVQAIYPLSFTLYDKNGLVVPSSQFSEIRWKIPVSSTMLKPVQGNDREHLQKDISQQYYIVNDHELTFTIADTYNSQFGNNDIILEIDIMGQTTKTVTNFTFLKDGVNGTNGTDYHCRISTVNTIEGYPTIYYNKDYQFLSTNFTGGFTHNLLGQPNSDSWFQVELWDSGKLITPDSVSWKVLTNSNYSSNINLLTVSGLANSRVSLAIKSEEFASLLDENSRIDFQSKFPLLTIQAEVTYGDVKYYATQPIVLIYLSSVLLNDSDPHFLQYRMEMKPNTGFNEAMYTSDGTNPQMNTAFPFEMCIKERIATNVEVGEGNDGIPILETTVVEADVTTQKGENAFIYDWSVYGSSANINGTNNKLMTISNMQDKVELPPHKRIVIPPLKYDDYHINNGVRCDIYEEDTFLATVLFPIHFYLNRYGLSFLNDWDGNSIDINEEEGRILSPQVGAGQKNDDNSFTGLFMGAVKSDDESTTKKIGLIGYNHSKQSIFLDAETGKAEFGVSGEGQIILEPGNQAIIKSGNYHQATAADGSDGTGMQIDLAAPAIDFGSGKFSVNNKGEMVAQGGGLIGGWTIGDKQLISANESVILQSDDNKSTAKITIKANNIPPDLSEEEPDEAETDETVEDDDVGIDTETEDPGNDREGSTEQNPAEKAIFEIYNYREATNENNTTYEIEEFVKLHPNKILFSSDKNNNSKYKKAEIYYVPGPKDSSKLSNFIGNAKTRINGYNCIRFTKPIGAGAMNSILKGYIGIPLISQNKKSYVSPLKNNGVFVEGSKNWKNQRAVKFGPAREYVDSIPHTIVRGKNVHIYGFGPTESGTAVNNGCIALRASHLYHSSAWQQTSDERIKDFYELDERYYNFFNKLTPMIYSYKGEDKKHCGYSAQAVKKALFESGLTLKDLDVVHIHNEEDLLDEQKYGIEDLHTLSYEALTPLYAAVLQKTIKELDIEKQKNILLQNEINKIKKHLQLD